MDTYSLLRQFADSWVLLAMFIFFVAAGIWAFLPSQSKAREDASMIPLRNDKDVVTRPDQNETRAGAAAPLALKGQTDG